MVLLLLCHLVMRYLIGIKVNKACLDNTNAHGPALPINHPHVGGGWTGAALAAGQVEDGGGSRSAYPVVVFRDAQGYA